MPRPKRGKVAPSAPITLPHQRVTQTPNTAPGARNQDAIESPASSARITNGSDDSDGLVVAKKAGAKAGNIAAQEYVMSGALALEDVGATRLRPPSAKTRATLTRIVRDADHAQGRLGVEARKRAAQKADIMEPESIPSSIPLKSSAKTNATGGSEYRSPGQGIQGLSRSKVQDTPRLHTSMLGIAPFKKRPRQPSLLQMVPPQTHAPEVIDDDDMYDFSPDDESTPFKKSLPQTDAHLTSSSSRLTTSSRKRKRATPEIQVYASQSQSPDPPTPKSPVPPQSLEEEDLYGVSTEEDQVQPSLPPHRPTSTLQPQIFSDTLAPPQSSSPPQSPPKAARINSAKGAKKSKPRANQPKRQQPSPALPPLSPESKNISPIRPAQPKPLSTATLQNLLPRRRARSKQKGDYDIPSSSEVELDNTALGEDEDELSFHVSKARRKTSRPTLPKSAARGKANAAKRASRTYTRKKHVLVENDGREDNESAVGDENVATGKDKGRDLDGKAKMEMKRLADKFREVDEFSLDFEDMTGSSSQMKDAR